MKTDKPIIYIMLYKKLKEHSNHNLEIEVARLNEIFNRKLWTFPKFYRNIIVNDMVKYGLLKRKNHMQFILVGENCDKILEKYSVSLW